MIGSSQLCKIEFHFVRRVLHKAASIWIVIVPEVYMTSYFSTWQAPPPSSREVQIDKKLFNCTCTRVRLAEILVLKRSLLCDPYHP